jgi:GNAT superfamily N-acetyltransferase
MKISLTAATDQDASEIAALRTAAAAKLTARHGVGPWSGVATEKGVRFEMRTSKVFVVRIRGRLVATLRLATKKPWAIARSYFTACRRPLYLLSMAVSPEFQSRGIGRRCLEHVQDICRQWPADAICLDAYEAEGGAGPFYAKCGFREVGRAAYRGCRLVYFELVL